MKKKDDILSGLNYLKKIPHERFFQLFVDGKVHLREEGGEGFLRREPGCIKAFYEGLFIAINQINSSLSVQFLLNVHKVLSHQVGGDFTLASGGCFRNTAIHPFAVNKARCTPKGILSFCTTHRIQGSSLMVQMGNTVQNLLDLSPQQLSEQINTIYENSDKNPLLYSPPTILPEMLFVKANQIINAYQYDIKKACFLEDADLKILAIVKCVRSFELLHPFSDANGRLFVNILLNYLLMQNGFPPATFYDPNVFDLYSEEELVEVVKDAIFYTLFIISYPDKTLFGYKPNNNKVQHSEIIDKCKNTIQVFDISHSMQLIQSYLKKNRTFFHAAAIGDIDFFKAHSMNSEIIFRKAENFMSPLYKGKTILQIATQMNQFEVLQYLASTFPNTILEPKILANAIRSRNVQMVDFLLAKEPMEPSNNALYIAAKSGSLAIFLKILALNVNPEFDVLFRLSCKKGNIPVINWMMQNTRLKCVNSMNNKDITKNPFLIMLTERQEKAFIVVWNYFYCHTRISFEMALFFFEHMVHHTRDDLFKFIISKTDLKTKTSPLPYSLIESFCFQSKHNMDIINLLLNMEDFPLNVQDREGKNLLHLAATTGKKALLKRLLKNHFPSNQQDNNGYTALHYAIYNNHTALIEILSPSPITKPNNEKKSVKSSEKMNTATELLFTGCRELCYSKVKEALENGANPNVKASMKYIEDTYIYNYENNWYSPLSLVAMPKKLSDLNSESIDSDACEIAQLLLNNGADPDLLDKGDMGNSCLHWAIFTHKRRLSQLLIHYAKQNNKQLINLYNRPEEECYGINTPLLLALKISCQSLLLQNFYNLDIVKLLIAMGADTNAKDFHKQTALHWASILRIPQDLMQSITIKTEVTLNAFNQLPQKLYEMLCTYEMIQTGTLNSFSDLNFFLTHWHIRVQTETTLKEALLLFLEKRNAIVFQGSITPLDSEKIRIAISVDANQAPFSVPNIINALKKVEFNASIICFSDGIDYINNGLLDNSLEAHEQACKRLISIFYKNYDALVIPGNSQNIDPGFFDNCSAFPPLDRDYNRRTFLELSLVKAAMSKGIPILGICGGIQIIAVALGGKVKDLSKITLRDTVFDSRQNNTRYEVCYLKNTELHRIIQKNKRLKDTNIYLYEFSAHTQALDESTLPKLLTVSARNGDIIKAVEMKVAYPWLMGTQYHPEAGDSVIHNGSNDEHNSHLFQDFLNATFIVKKQQIKKNIVLKELLTHPTLLKFANEKINIHELDINILTTCLQKKSITSVAYLLQQELDPLIKNRIIEKYTEHCDAKKLSMLMPAIEENQRINFLIKNKDKIKDIDDAIFFITFIPSQEKPLFLKNYLGNINNGFQVANVLKQLKKKEQLPYCRLHFAKIRDIGELSAILTNLAKSLRLIIAREHCEKLNNPDALLLILETLCKPDRYSFAMENSCLIISRTLPKVLSILPSGGHKHILSKNITKIKTFNDLILVINEIIPYPKTDPINDLILLIPIKQLKQIMQILDSSPQKILDKINLEIISKNLKKHLYLCLLLTIKSKNMSNRFFSEPHQPFIEMLIEFIIKQNANYIDIQRRFPQAFQNPFFKNIFENLQQMKVEQNSHLNRAAFR